MTYKVLSLFLSVVTCFNSIDKVGPFGLMVGVVTRLKKGHALAEKAGARTDFSYVPGHLGEF